MEIQTELETNVIMDSAIEQNLRVSVSDRQITLTLNPNRIYTTILNKDVILGFINREITNCLLLHLKSMAKKEKEREALR